MILNAQWCTIGNLFRRTTGAKSKQIIQRMALGSFLMLVFVAPGGVAPLMWKPGRVAVPRGPNPLNFNEKGVVHQGREMAARRCARVIQSARKSSQRMTETKNEAQTMNARENTTRDKESSTNANQCVAPLQRKTDVKPQSYPELGVYWGNFPTQDSRKPTDGIHRNKPKKKEEVMYPMVRWRWQTQERLPPVQAYSTPPPPTPSSNGEPKSDEDKEMPSARTWDILNTRSCDKFLTWWEKFNTIDPPQKSCFEKVTSWFVTSFCDNFLREREAIRKKIKERVEEYCLSSGERWTYPLPKCRSYTDPIFECTRIFVQKMRDDEEGNSKPMTVLQREDLSEFLSDLLDIRNTAELYDKHLESLAADIQTRPAAGPSNRAR